MKMTLPTFTALQGVIQHADTDQRRAAYREGRYPNAERTRDADMRYRWDLLWAVIGLLPDAARGEVYNLKDTHIDTALRRIVSHL